MYDMPISQAAIDLGLRSQMAKEARDDENKRKKTGEKKPSLADQLMGGVASDIFGGS